MFKLFFSTIYTFQLLLFLIEKTQNYVFNNERLGRLSTINYCSYFFLEKKKSLTETFSFSYYYFQTFFFFSTLSHMTYYFDVRAYFGSSSILF